MTVTGIEFDGCKNKRNLAEHCLATNFTLFLYCYLFSIFKVIFSFPLKCQNLSWKHKFHFTGNLMLMEILRRNNIHVSECMTYSTKKNGIPVPCLLAIWFNLTSSKCIKKFNEAQCEHIAMRRRAISMSSYLNCPVRTDDVCIKRLFIAETHHGLIRHGLAPLGILENLYTFTFT